MNISTELSVEFRRLARNLNSLKEKWEEHVARDLAASLRNWVQLAKEIDNLAESEGWKLMFPVHPKTKAEKRVFNDGSEAFYTPSTVTNGPMMVAAASFHPGKISQEENKAIVAAGPDGGPANQQMALEAWLNGEVYEIKKDAKRTGISRKLYVERCANMLGGTHPATMYKPEINEQVFDMQILELLNTQLVGIPLPWAFISETAQGIVKAFEPYLAT